MCDPYAAGRKTLEDRREALRPRLLAIIAEHAPRTVEKPDDDTRLDADFHVFGTAMELIAEDIDDELGVSLGIEELLNWALLGPSFGRLLDLVVERFDE